MTHVKPRSQTLSMRVEHLCVRREGLIPEACAEPNSANVLLGVEDRGGAQGDQDVVAHAGRGTGW